MKLNLLAFGIAKDITGRRFSEWNMSDGATLADLRRELARKFPQLENLAALRFAVNSEYATENHPLQEGDEVALIPPVSGG